MGQTIKMGQLYWRMKMASSRTRDREEVLTSEKCQSLLAEGDAIQQDPTAQQHEMLVSEIESTDGHLGTALRFVTLTLVIVIRESGLTIIELELGCGHSKFNKSVAQFTNDLTTILRQNRKTGQPIQMGQPVLWQTRQTIKMGQLYSYWWNRRNSLSGPDRRSWSRRDSLYTDGTAM